MSFFSSKSKHTFVLSVSLKSSSIDFQLIKSIDGAKKEVLFAERKIILLENSQDPQLYTTQCVKELSTLFQKNCTKIKQLSHGGILQMHIILFAPWFTSAISSIIQKEQVTIDANFLTKKLANLKADENLRNLEKRIIKIQANGYTLTELTHEKCSNIFLSVYSSYVSEHIHSLFMDVVKKYLPEFKHVTYTTSPLLILDNIKRFMIKEDNVTYIYIGEEITEVGVIEDDSLAHFATFPVGKHDFLREIQTHILTYDYDMLYQKEIQIKSQSQQENFRLLQQKWAGSVVGSLELFNKNVPSKILIIADTKTKEFFTNVLLTSIKENPQSILKNNRIINFDISLLKDIISYKTPLGENELDLKLEALI